MLEMNKVMLIGNLTRDPECSRTQSGTALAKLGLAVNRRYKNTQTQEWEEETAFVDVDAWGKSAEFAEQYLKKGVRIYVEGRLRYNSWEDQSGQKRSRITVTAERLQFALPRSQQEQRAAPAPAPAQQQSAAPAGDSNAEWLAFYTDRKNRGMSDNEIFAEWAQKGASAPTPSAPAAPPAAAPSNDLPF